MEAAADSRTAVGRAFAALRGAAAASPEDGRALLVVRGSDRLPFLQGMLTNDVASLRPGDGALALLLTDQGKIVADLRVLALEDEVWLDVPRAARAAVRAALERLIVADDVELDELPHAAIALRGPEAASLLGRLCPAAADAIAGSAEGRHAAATIAGSEVRVARVRDLGVDGFRLWAAEPGAGAALLRAVCAAGAVAAPGEALEAQRIDAGVALAGIDFDAQTLAAEVPSLAAAISYRKGCYLGQEVVERIAARGHVNWLVVRLTVGPGAAVEAGAAVLHEGVEVGRVTSAAVRPDDGAVVALARVRRAAAEPGTEVVVSAGGGEARAMVRQAAEV